MNDWRNSLQSLLDGGDLPQDDGPDADATATDTRGHSGVRLVVSMEKKGRGGKTATIISGFADGDDIEEIASVLKRKLGAGGSARGGEILIQGDRRTDVIKPLRELGFKL